jgi:anti-anti-sigma factor
VSWRVDHRGPDSVVLRLSGELLSSDTPAAAVERTLEGHLNSGVRRIRIDLEGVDSIDLEGVGVLIDLLRHSEQRGRSMSIEHAHGPVRDKLRTTGVLQFLERAS